MDKLEIHKRLQNIQIEGIEFSDLEISNEDINISEYYGLDSLDFMKFVFAVENEFSIQFRDDIGYDELNKLSLLVAEIKECLDDSSTSDTR